MQKDDFYLHIKYPSVCLIAIAHMIFKHMKDIKINAHLYYEPTEVYREKKKEKFQKNTRSDMKIQKYCEAQGKGQGKGWNQEGHSKVIYGWWMVDGGYPFPDALH